MKRNEMLLLQRWLNLTAMLSKSNQKKTYATTKLDYVVKGYILRKKIPKKLGSWEGRGRGQQRHFLDASY